MRFKYLKKILALLVVFVQVLAPVAAQASLIEDSSVSDMVLDSLKELNVASEAVKSFSQYFNPGSNKSSIQAPTLRVVITPTDPKQGEEVVAKALPVGFANDKKSAYFTWYLKRNGCDLTPPEESLDKNGDPEDVDEDGPTYKTCDERFSDKNGDDWKTCDRCDDDQDGIITVNDWKVKASKIIALNGFETPVDDE
ncbi:hypothetical protein EPO05_03570, partial [Patescibacteria group bacterium]